MKKTICVLFSLLSFGTAFASWTAIDSDAPFQCNNWGWIKDRTHMAWFNSCTPLSVDAGDRIISIRSTEDDCKEKEHQSPSYRYVAGSDKIELVRCISIRE